MKVHIHLLENYIINPQGITKITLPLSLPLDFLIKEQVLISLPPLTFGGNHQHPRREIFICLNEQVEFQWIDEEGKKHAHKMCEDEKIYVFDVHPLTPHAIVNLSAHSSATLLEFADSHQYGVKESQVYETSSHCA